MMLDNIGKLVHQQRRSMNLTIEKLAERSGVSVSYPAWSVVMSTISASRS